jgi:hypothetical protein
LLPEARAEAIYGVQGAAEIRAAAEKPLRRRLAEIKELEKLRGSEFAKSTFQKKLGDFRGIASKATVTPRGVPGTPPDLRKVFRQTHEFRRTGDVAATKNLPRRERKAILKASEIFANRIKQRERELAEASIRRGKGRRRRKRK